MSEVGKWILNNAEVSKAGKLEIDLYKLAFEKRTQYAMYAFALKIQIKPLYN